MTFVFLVAAALVTIYALLKVAAGASSPIPDIHGINSSITLAVALWALTGASFLVGFVL
jgi:hypothetical protein